MCLAASHDDPFANAVLHAPFFGDTNRVLGDGGPLAATEAQGAKRLPHELGWLVLSREFHRMAPEAACAEARLHRVMVPDRS